MSQLACGSKFSFPHMIYLGKVGKNRDASPCHSSMWKGILWVRVAFSKNVIFEAHTGDSPLSDSGNSALATQFPEMLICARERGAKWEIIWRE